MEWTRRQVISLVHDWLWSWDNDRTETCVVIAWTIAAAVATCVITSIPAITQ